MKQIYFLLLFLVLVNGTLAIQVIAGESVTITLGEEFDYYSIVGNSSPIDLIVEQSGLDVIITFDKYQQEDNFELIFFNKEKETITVYQSSGGGGGSRTVYRDRNITKYLDREIEVEKIVEVDNSEEIDEYVNIADEAVKGEHFWKILFIGSLAIIIVIILYKLYNLFFVKVDEYIEEVKKEIPEEKSNKENIFGNVFEDENLKGGQNEYK